MNDAPDIKARIKSAVVTFVVAALLLFFLFYVRVSMAVPLVEEGIVIRFGDEHQDSAPFPETATSEKTIVSTEAARSEENPAPSISKTTSAPTPKEKDVFTQDLKESIALKKGKKKTKDPDDQTKKETKSRKLIDPKKSSDNAVEKSGEVRTAKKLDRQTKDALERILKGKPGGAKGKERIAPGRPDGDKRSISNTGKEGSASSGNYQLGGRRALQKPLPDYPCDQEGVIVVRVIVDRAGKVIEAVPGIKGTTNAAACLKAPAKEAALKTLWEAAPKAPARQMGKIIYRFRIK